MANTVSIVNMKGGVGKTTLTLHLAYDLAFRHRKRVLVVDCDPQANATEGLIVPSVYKSHRETKLTVSDLFSETRNALGPVASASAISLPSLEAIICRARDFGSRAFVDLAPADIYLSNILERARGPNLEERLSTLLAPKKASSAESVGEFWLG